MRRFFISGFERLLSVLTILSVLAVAALAARIAVEAQPGDTRQYLTAAAVLIGGWLVVVAVAGVSFLAIAIHDNSRRMIGLMAQGTKGARPLTATRKPESAPAKARPAPLLPESAPEPVHDAWDDGQDNEETIAPRPAPKPAAPVSQPVSQPVLQAAERPVFSGRTMPRAHAEPAPVPVTQPAVIAEQLAGPRVTEPATAKAPDAPAPSHSSPVARAPRLIAERRFPR